MKIIDGKDVLRDREALCVLSYSQYMPTEEKLKNLASTYEADPNIFVLSCADEERVIGLIVLRRNAVSAVEIVSIAVEPAYRGLGIGSKLIASAANSLTCDEISAETDEDAVGFYRSYGFEIVSLGEKYPGCTRYLCTLKFP